MVVDLNLPTPGEVPNWAPALNAEILEVARGINLVHAQTVFVDDMPGDSGSDKWQAAVDRVREIRGGVYVEGDPLIKIVGSAESYEFSAPVDIRGVQGVAFVGSEGGFTRLTAAPGAGGVNLFMARAGAFSGTTSDISFQGFSIHGGLTAVAPDGVFDRRQDNIWAEDRVTAFVHMSGSLVPSESANGVVKNVQVSGNVIYGVYSLPLHFRGVENVSVTNNFIKRSLDTGFTWCRNVKFSGNTVQWSADNGVSLSRGCEQGVISSNTIEGSYYAGIHVGGFGSDPGPLRVVVTGNTVLNSRQYGISAKDGTSESVITSNVVDGVRRGAPSDANRDALGDAAPVMYGTGILVGGLVTGESTGAAEVVGYAIDNIVSNNTVKNADRNGIFVTGGTRRIAISGNVVTNVGSEFSVNGSTAISATHTGYNVGIGVYGPSSTLINFVTLTGNMVSETRATQIIGRSYSLNDSCTCASNFDWNVRTPLGTKFSVRGSGSVNQAIEFAVGQEARDFEIRQLAANRTLSFTGFLNGATSEALRLTRSGAVFTPNVSTISGVTSNVYIDAQGELRKIT